MGKRRKKNRNRRGMQVITLCISTALVLILLGSVVLTVLTARNLNNLVKENIVVTLLLEQDMTDAEAKQLSGKLQVRPYIKAVEYISKEKVLQEQKTLLGADPTEFTQGINFYLSSLEITLKGDYANSDSLKWIVPELRSVPKVSDITYQEELVNSINSKLKRITLVLLVLAGLLTIVSFSLINNTVRLGIYARRFSIHTMKLVGASWGFIRRPFVYDAISIGLIAAVLATGAIGGGIYALATYEPGILAVVTPEVQIITTLSIFFFGISITALCAGISVNKFLKMKAGELYKI